MMKAICIKNEREVVYVFDLGESKHGIFDLTIGKVYEIYELHEFAPNILPKKCRVIDNLGKTIHTEFDFFKPIEEYRNEQIEEILK